MQNWFWSLAVHVPGRVLRNVPDAGGPGGPTPGGVSDDAGPSAGADGDDSTLDASDAGREPQARADEDDDSLDDDDAGFDQAYHDELKARDPKAAKKYRNAINRSKAAVPLLQTLRTLGIDPKDRTAVAAFLRNGVTPKPASAPAPPAQDTRSPEPKPEKWKPLRTDEPFDESPFRGWDLGDASNKALFESLKSGHQTRMETRMLVNAFMAQDEVIQGLKDEIRQIREGGQAEKRQAESANWRTEVDAGVKQIKDPEVAEAFRDSVAGAVMRETRAGRKPNAKAIVATVLQRFKRTGQITPAEAARVAAGAQAIADRNRSAPTRAAIAPGGAPASPRIDRSQERIGDVNRRLLGKRYIGAMR